MKYSNENNPIVCMQTNNLCYKNTHDMKVLGILWHSTAANNTYIKRYVQPSEDDPKYSELMDLLGKNAYKNDWNHTNRKAGLNCWVGRLADGTVATVQTMPWNFAPWGCGSGWRGSCNEGWIQFEICEDNRKGKDYFDKVYKEACEITAYLCDMFDIDPEGTVRYAGINVPTILCHSDSHNLGLGSNHSDVLHWLPTFGKDMNSVRADVAKILNEHKNGGVMTPPVDQETPDTDPAENKTLNLEDINIGDILYFSGNKSYKSATATTFHPAKQGLVKVTHKYEKGIHPLHCRSIDSDGKFVSGVYGWVNLESLHRFEEDAQDEWTPEVNDVVNFSGDTHYVSSNGTSPSTCKPGLATITRINPKAKHPYHLIRVRPGESTVYGWVDDGTFTRAE